MFDRNYQSGHSVVKSGSDPVAWPSAAVRPAEFPSLGLSYARLFFLGVLCSLAVVHSKAALPPVITSPTNLTANPGVTIAYQITASNSPTAFGATGLPSGWNWTINPSSGVVEGRIPATGTVGTTITFNVIATNAAGASPPVTVACAVVAQAMASQQYRVGSFAAPAPVPFWASAPVLPNDSVLVTGGRIFLSTVAQLALLTNGATGSPGLPALLGASWGTVQPGTATNRSVHVGIPAAWSAGIYALRLANGTAIGPAILVNAPDPWYAMGDGGCEASPGGTLYLAGHCLAYTNQTNTIALVQNGTVSALMTGTPMASDLRGWGYAVTSSIPVTLAAGLYEVWVHNGFGGADGWAKLADPLSVIPVFTWPTNTIIFNNMSAANDDARMAAAFSALGSGGGTIVLPATNLNLTASIGLPIRCRLQGQGITNTILSFAGSCTNPLINSALGSTFALEDLKIYAPTDFVGTAVRRAYQTAYQPGWMKRVNITLDAPAYDPTNAAANSPNHCNVFIRQTTDFVMEDCVISGTSPVSGLDTVFGLRLSRCTLNWKLNALYLQGMTTHAIFDRCIFNVTGDPTINHWTNWNNPNFGIGFGAFKAGIGSIGGQYIKNILVANCANTRDQTNYTMPGYVGYTSDGEGSFYTGTFTANGTTLTLASNTLSWQGTNQLNYDFTGCRVSILDGTGAGQHRTVIAGATTNSPALTIDRPWDVAPDGTSVMDAGCQIGNTLMVNNDWGGVRLIQHYFNGVNNTVAGGTAGCPDGTTACVAWSGPHYQGYEPNAQMQYLSINNQSGLVNYQILCSDSSTNQPPAPHYAGERGLVVRDMRTSNGGSVAGRTQCGYTVGSYTVHMPVCGVLYENFPGPLTYASLNDYGGAYAARLIATNGTALPTTAVRLSDSPYPLPAPAVSDPTPTNPFVNVGTSAVFSVTATGTPTPTLQWQREPLAGAWANLVEGTNYLGVTSSTLTVTNLTVAMIGDQFRCVATNDAGAVISGTATLTVLEDFATWAASQGLTTNNGTLGQYAFSTLPDATNSSQPLTVTLGGGQCVFRFTRPSWVTGITYTLQASADLVTWTNSPGQPVVESSTATNDTLAVTFAASAPQRFMRLLVTAP